MISLSLGFSFNDADDDDDDVVSIEKSSKATVERATNGGTNTSHVATMKKPITFPMAATIRKLAF
jgi:hypothetical protein